MAADLPPSPLSQSPDKRGGVGIFAPVLNFSHVVLWFLGNRQEFLKAWLHLLIWCSQLCHMSGKCREAC